MDFSYKKSLQSVTVLLLLHIFCFSAFGQVDDTNVDEQNKDIVTLPPVVIKLERIEKKPKHTFGNQLINRSVGSGGDPIRVLDQLPSVGVLNDFVGILSIRGGGPEDNLYYFDRLPLGYPYHLLGIVSTVNAEVIQNIDVYPGGYGAEYGSDSQAVIDINSRRITDATIGGKLNLNPVYSQAFFEGNLGQRGYWYVFGRMSYMRTLFELLPRLLDIEDDLVTQVPSFWSYQGKFVYQLTKTHRVVFNTIAADDSAEFRFTSNEVSSSDLRGPLQSENPFDSQGIHLYSEKEESFKSIFSLTRSFSGTQLHFGEEYFFRSTDTITSFRGDLQYWAKFPKTFLESGFDLSITPSNIISNGARPLDEGDWDYDFRIKKDGEKVLTNTTKNLHRLEGYAQVTHDLFTTRYVDLYATIGLRSSYYSLIDRLSLQPRGLIGVTLGPRETVGYSLSLFPLDLRFMYGKYVQNPQLFQATLGNVNPKISPSSARHYVVVIDKSLTPDTKIEVTGYYKNLKDMITYNLLEKRYENERSGSVRGIEAAIEHKIGDVFRGWVAYAYTVSKRQDSSKEKEREFMYSTPHVLTVNLNYMFGSLEFGANWQYKSGTLYAPLDDRQLYTNPFTNRQTWIPVYGDPLRTSSYHRLDLRFHWSFLPYERWKGGLTFELWNVYNRANPLQIRYNSDFTKEVPIYQLPIVPFLAITLEF